MGHFSGLSDGAIIDNVSSTANRIDIITSIIWQALRILIMILLCNGLGIGSIFTVTGSVQNIFLFLCQTIVSRLIYFI